MLEDLIQRFGSPRDISSDAGDNEMLRVTLLHDLNSLTHYAVQGNYVLVRTVKGRCLVERRSEGAAKLVHFTYQEHNKTDSVTFWFNASSVQHVATLLRENTGKRVPMEALSQ